MRYVIVLLLIILFSCSDTETVGTQTGNPATVSLYYALDTETSSYKRRSEDSLVSKIDIEEVIIVISEVRLESDTDSLSFRKEEPYFLALTDKGVTTFLDSAVSTVGSSFEELELRIRKIDSHPDDTALTDNSIVVRGTVNDGEPFLFTSALSENIRIENPLDIESISSTITLTFDILSWFSDSASGSFLDPREKDNFSEIESQIKKSFTLK